MSNVITLHGQKIRFEWQRAQVQQIKFWNETQISSSGGEGYMYDGYGYIAPLKIHSRNQQWQRVHVRWSDVKTGVVTVPGWVGISEGDEVSFLAAVNEQNKKWGWQGLTNHSAGQWYAYPSGAEVAKFQPKGFFDHYVVMLVHAGFAGGAIGHLFFTGLLWWAVGWTFWQMMRDRAHAIALAVAVPFFFYGLFKLVRVLMKVAKDQSAFNEEVNSALRNQPLLADAVPAQ